MLGEPASEIGLSNTVGTVALALPGDGMGGTNQNAGTSSFFVNLTSNTFLDADFTVFAAIPDMTVINEIMALMQTDLTDETQTRISAPARKLGFQRCAVAGQRPAGVHQAGVRDQRHVGNSPRDGRCRVDHGNVGRGV